MVGNTPLVHLRNIEKDFDLNCNLCELILRPENSFIISFILISFIYKDAKCEFMSAAGSVKDRIGNKSI